MADATAGSVHVVIVNWNTGDYLRRCLESIVRANQEDGRLARVTVIDNASSDRSASKLEDLNLPLEVVHNQTNRGFAAACNQGAAGSEAEYLLFLNPDTELFSDTLEIVTKFMGSADAAHVGVCGAQVLDPHGRPTISCARFPTLRVFLGAMTGLDKILPGLFPSHQLRPAETPRSGEVDQVIGAFFFVRRNLFTRLGGFDTRYFIYYEEVDFALRARREGLLSYLLKEARVLHVAHVSSVQARDLRLYHSLRSRLIYARSHWPSPRARALAAMTFAVELPARLTKALLRASWTELRATAAAYRVLARDCLRTR